MGRRAATENQLAKLKVLGRELKPVPFVPDYKTLNIAANHKRLLQTVGLWEFLHVDFRQEIDRDMLVQLIAFCRSDYNNRRRSHVGKHGYRVDLTSTELAEALRLPLYSTPRKILEKEKEILESEESVRFLEEVVRKWMLLPNDNTVVVRDLPEFKEYRWIDLLWEKVKRELEADPPVGDCFYATHLHLLANNQLEKKKKMKQEEEMRWRRRRQEEEMRWRRRRFYSNEDREEHQGIYIFGGGHESLHNQDHSMESQSSTTKNKNKMKDIAEEEQKKTPKENKTSKEIIEEGEKRVMETKKKLRKKMKKKTQEPKKVIWEKDEEMKKVIAEKDEELKKVIAEKDEEPKKVIRDKDEEMKKVIAEKDEELKKVIAEKDEEPKKVTKEMNDKLEEKRCELEDLEDTNLALLIKERQNNDEIQEARRELEKAMKEMNDKLEDERCELEILEDTNSALLIKERQSNDEIQEARRELIRGLRDLSGDGSGATVRVKRMGEVDEKPFKKACEQRFTGPEVALEHALLCSKWQDTIKNPAWYPFKRLGTGEKMKEVVDEEDEKLENLRQEWGEDVKNAVKTSLEELNEFNPSGRYPVPVLWNFEHDRKATLKEGIAHMKQQVKHLKRKRT